MLPGSLKFCPPFNEWTLIGQTCTDIQKEKKSGLRRKLKVSTLDIQIKQLGLKVSDLKVFSSGIYLKVIRKLGFSKTDVQGHLHVSNYV